MRKPRRSSGEITLPRCRARASRCGVTLSGGVGLKLVPLRVTAPAVVDRAAGASGGVRATIRIGQAMRIDLRELPPVPWLAELQRAVEERR